MPTDIYLIWEVKNLPALIIRLPDECNIESLPSNVAFESSFGKYSIKITSTGQKIDIFRSMTRYRGTFPPEKYAEMCKWYRDIAKADQSNIVLICPREE
jgi:hypothetical protein